MTHWGWYWKVKLKHKRRESCERLSLCEIDSFTMYKQHQIESIRQTASRLMLIIPDHNLEAFLQGDDSLLVHYQGGTYAIHVEKKPCNYGGFYYFFKCPQCDKRMRKLYCIDGKYLCRKCAHLGYYSQRLRPSERLARRRYKVEEHLKNYAGTLDIKPPRMKQHTFQKLRSQFVKFDEMQFDASRAEFRLWHESKSDLLLPDPYCLLMPSNLYDAYVER